VQLRELLEEFKGEKYEAREQAEKTIAGLKIQVKEAARIK